MLIRAIQVRQFDDPCAAALAIASRRMNCDVSDLYVVLLGNGHREVTRTASAAKRTEFWMLHKATGKYLTTVGLVSSLEFDGGKIAGYYTVRVAKMVLHTQAIINNIRWDELEAVTL